jgi:branched-chain amino acid transport system permease protein
VTGGSNGLNGFANEFQEWNPLNPSQQYGGPLLGKLNFEFSGADLWELMVGATLIAISVLVMWLLVNSPWGRVLKSIREDEDAARALGKNVFRFKMQSLILGGTFGTIAGMFFAIANNSVQPDNYSTPVTFFALTAAIMGGLGRVLGPVVGSMIFWMILAFTDNLLRQLVGEDYIPESIMDSVQIGQVRFLLVGLLLVLLMVFRPQGIFGDRREIAIDARK